MSDDQQVMNDTKSSTKAKSLDGKSIKNRLVAVKKSKKQQQQQPHNSYSEIQSTEPSKSTERNTGSVVITIRLLKMESSKCIDAASNVVDETQNKTISGNLPENHNHLDNNHLNGSEFGANNWFKGNSGIKINSFINNGGERCNSINQLTNGALHSEAKICDKNQINCESNGMINGLTQPLNAMKLTDITMTTGSNDQKFIKSDTSAFIPMDLITPVSPYPHHIPIAIRTDCLNAAAVAVAANATVAGDECKL